MFLEQETDYSAYFKIYAAFPLVNYFLKNHLAEVLVPPDMIQKQMNDLLSQIRNTTVHPIVRGVLYEKYILERLIKAKSQQKPFALLASPSKYLSYHSNHLMMQVPLNYKVTFFNGILLILELEFTICEICHRN